MIRDTNTMALLNSDLESLNKYKEQRKNFGKTKSIVDDVENIKVLLKSVVDRLEQIEERLK